MVYEYEGKEVTADWPPETLIQIIRELVDEREYLFRTQRREYGLLRDLDRAQDRARGR